MTPYIPYHLKTQNRQLIYDVFQEKKISSRAEVVRLTGISFPTVLKTVDKLLELGLLTELEEQEQISGAGRRGHLLQFNPDSYMAIGLQFDGRYASIGLVNLNGNVQEYTRFPFLCTPKYLLNQKYNSETLQTLHHQLIPISEAIQSLYTKSIQQSIPVLGIGIGFPSMIHPEKKCILHTTSMGTSEELPFDTIFPEFVKSFPLPYYLGNDVNLACQGESFLRNLILPKSNLLYITLGNGCGAGIMQNGKLWYGSTFRSGEIGHLPVFPSPDQFHAPVQTLESKISLQALYEMFQIHLEQTPELWKQHPDIAQQICAYLCPYLGHLMLTLSSILDIHLCVITGPTAEALGPYLLEQTQALLSHLYHGNPIQLVPPIQTTSGITGTAVSVFQQSFEELLNK